MFWISCPSVPAEVLRCSLACSSVSKSLPVSSYCNNLAFILEPTIAFVGTLFINEVRMAFLLENTATVTSLARSLMMSFLALMQS